MSLRTAVIIIVLIHVGIITSQVIKNPVHLGDPTWPDHAKNHVLEGLLWVVGFNMSAIVVALIPFRRGERWAWWLQLFMLLGIVGSFLAAPFFTHGGAEPLATTSFSIMGIVYLVVLALSWRNTKSFQSLASQ